MSRDTRRDTLLELRTKLQGTLDGVNKALEELDAEEASELESS